MVDRVFDAADHIFADHVPGNPNNEEIAEPLIEQ